MGHGVVCLIVEYNVVGPFHFAMSPLFAFSAFLLLWIGVMGCFVVYYRPSFLSFPYPQMMWILIDEDLLSFERGRWELLLFYKS